MGKLLVLDGFSLAFRAFFALPETMVTASGQYTNAVHGFTSMLLNLVKDHKPTHIVVAFDHPAPTFRDELSSTYKGTRSKTPESLLSQIPFIAHVVESYGICLVEAPGFEADDVIATIAQMALVRELETIIVTGDRDSFQLVCDPYVRVLYNRRGVSDYELLDEAGVEVRMGVKPTLYPQFAALRGDPSDNLPGVPGVGPKTAAKLINDYGSIDSIMEHLQDLSPKLRNSLHDYQAQVKMNLDLIPLVRTVPLDVSIDDMELGPWNSSATRELFKFLEFNRIWERSLSIFEFRLRATGGQSEESGLDIAIIEENQRYSQPDFDVLEASTIDDVIQFVRAVDPSSLIYLEVEWEGAKGRSLPRALVVAGSNTNGGDIVLSVTPVLLGDETVVEQLFSILSNRLPPICGVDLKELLRYLYTNQLATFEVDIDGGVVDYLIDPSAGDYHLDALISKWLGEVGESPGMGSQLTMDLDARADPLALANKAVAGLGVVRRMSPVLDERGLGSLYREIERPLIGVLAKMEASGIHVDRDYLVNLQREFAQEAVQLQDEIQTLAGSKFNVNSTQQLGKILFEELKLPPQKRTKTGYSTDARSLERLVELHPIIPKIMRYREVEKLRSTYGESLIAEIDVDGRIHASFSQTVARTGRLSSDHPNLHNIPIRTQDGKRFRHAFTAPEARKFVIADYSQIELRVIAHLSQDPGLIEAFSEGVDIHSQTASYTFGVPLSEVTSSQRNRAKMVAYGLAYGMEAYGLSQRLGISVSEANEILKAFFEGFPLVSAYMKSTVAEARINGYTSTEFGRVRPLPELHSSSFRIREAAERQAMNAGIQGLAADVFKLALVKLDSDLEAYDAQIVLQVHDEVIVECTDDIVEDIEVLVATTLREAVSLTVPLEVNVYSGTTWGDAK